MHTGRYITGVWAGPVGKTPCFLHHVQVNHAEAFAASGGLIGMAIIREGSEEFKKFVQFRSGSNFSWKCFPAYSTMPVKVKKSEIIVVDPKNLHPSLGRLPSHPDIVPLLSMDEKKARTKASQERYRNSDLGMATREAYNKSDARKASDERYNKSDLGKASQERYRNSDLGRATREAYNKSDARKASDERYKNGKGKSQESKDKKKAATQRWLNSSTSKCKIDGCEKHWKIYGFCSKHRPKCPHCNKRKIHKVTNDGRGICGPCHKKKYSY